MFTIDIDVSEVENIEKVAEAIIERSKEAALDGLATMSAEVADLERLIIDEQISFEKKLSGSVTSGIHEKSFFAWAGPRAGADNSEKKIAAIHDGAPQARWVPLARLRVWAAKKLQNAELGKAVQLRIAGMVEGKPPGTSQWQMQRNGKLGFEFDVETMNDPRSEAIGARGAEQIGNYIVSGFDGS